VDQRSDRDFFISYTDVNEAWAQWIAVELERAGYTTVVQAFDFRPGADFVHEMHRATASAARTIAVVSPAYFGSRFAESEWRAAFAKDPSGERGLLLPVRVQPCKPPGLLATRVFVDLVDLDETEARERLLTAVGTPAPRPTSVPFPGAPSGGNRLGRAPFPGSRAPHVSAVAPAVNGNRAESQPFFSTPIDRLDVHLNFVSTRRKVHFWQKDDVLGSKEYKLVSAAAQRVSKMMEAAGALFDGRTSRNLRRKREKPELWGMQLAQLTRDDRWILVGLNIDRLLNEAAKMYQIRINRSNPWSNTPDRVFSALRPDVESAERFKTAADAVAQQIRSLTETQS
jgi:hypothetical protein